MNRVLQSLLGVLFLLAGSTLVWALNTPPVKTVGTRTVKWAGCGITKQAFMDELTKAYQKKASIERKK